MNVKFVAGLPLILHSLDSGRDICESRLGLLVRSEGDDGVVELRGVQSFGSANFRLHRQEYVLCRWLASRYPAPAGHPGAGCRGRILPQSVNSNTAASRSFRRRI